jgi:hypothetical protein
MMHENECVFGVKLYGNTLGVFDLFVQGSRTVRVRLSMHLMIHGDARQS